MKKIYKILMVLLLILTVSGCKNSVGYSKISYNDLMKKLENKDSFILMIGSSECPHCDSFKLTLEEINKKYSIDVQYIDILEITDQSNISNLKSHFPYTGTPTTINIVNGVERNSLDRIEGTDDYLDVKNKLVKWGYIKE